MITKLKVVEHPMEQLSKPEVNWSVGRRITIKLICIGAAATALLIYGIIEHEHKVAVWRAPAQQVVR
jgi:hypothetical protein